MLTGTILLYAIILVLANLFVDIAYAWLVRAFDSNDNKEHPGTFLVTLAQAYAALSSKEELFLFVDLNAPYQP